MSTEYRSILATVERLERQSKEKEQKKERYECDYTLNECRIRARIMDALSDPNRWHILNILMKYGGNINVYDIVDTMNVAQPTVSHHLRILQERGFIDNRKVGLEVFYFVIPDIYDTVIQLVEELIPTKEKING